MKTPMTVVALALAAGITAQTALADVTLINVFEVPEGQRAAVVEQWETARDFLKEQPGYISTALHASIDEDARFALVNVARWETIQDFKQAAERLRGSAAYPRIEGLGINPALYEVIRSDRPRGWGGPPWARRDWTD